MHILGHCDSVPAYQSAALRQNPFAPTEIEVVRSQPFRPRVALPLG